MNNDQKITVLEECLRLYREQIKGLLMIRDELKSSAEEAQKHFEESLADVNEQIEKNRLMMVVISESLGNLDWKTINNINNKEN